MEELRSTEALDREILEDARKKAFRILKSADEMAVASRVGWERKLGETLEKARKAYSKRHEKSRNEIMARLPLEERHLRLEKIDSLLKAAMDGFLGSLDRSRLLAILERELLLRADSATAAIKAFFPGATEKAGAAITAELRYRGFSPAEMSALAEKYFPGVSIACHEDTLQAIAGAFPALVIDFTPLRINVSIDAVSGELLLDKRAELARSLLGNLEDIAPDLPEEKEACHG